MTNGDEGDTQNGYMTVSVIQSRIGDDNNHNNTGDGNKNTQPQSDVLVNSLPNLFPSGR